MTHYLNNLKMHKKLLLSPLVVMSSLIVFGIVSYIGLMGQQSAIKEIFNTRFGAYQASAKVLADVQNVHANIYKLISWSNANFDDKKIDDLAKSQIATIEQSRAAVGKFLKLTDANTEQKKNYQIALEQLTGYKQTVLKVVDMVSADFSLATTMMMAADDKFQVLNKTLQDLLSLENKLSKESYDFSQKSFARVLVISIAVMVIAIALSLFISIFMAKLILRPINKTIEVIEDISRGDLTKRIDIHATDEIGEMSRHFNVFVDKLHETITKVANSSSDVSSAAATLDSAAEQMAAGVEQAATQVNSVATASEEMSTTSSEIAQNCVMVAKSSEKANASAVTGEEIIQETISVMTRINERVKQSAGIIKKLGTRSEQIGEVVGLINEIADQTNLLALNAAIEAARAGEHGRGFAVVADEVRKLAERTTEATKEIGDTIEAMQSETKNAVVSMKEGEDEVEQGAKEASKSGDALKDILKQVNTVTTEINQIAVASEEQTATTNEIATNIQQISEVMQDTAKRIQENAGASAQLANLSKELQSLVGQFRV
ncbi:MAG: HAMP domain-containing protein [Syntrophorhabdaceae bacterium]|nr:HAMP domain-containing protein [Syntrophorhabdaceae bacterium]